MNYTRLFVVLLVLLQFGAAVSYAADHNWRMSAYWVLASSITAVVSL